MSSYLEDETTDWKEQQTLHIALIRRENNGKSNYNALNQHRENYLW